MPAPNKLPEDGILVPKHVAISAQYEVCVLWCVLLYSNLLILLVKAWDLKKIRGLNNIEDLEMM